MESRPRSKDTSSGEEADDYDALREKLERKERRRQCHASSTTSDSDKDWEKVGGQQKAESAMDVDDEASTVAPSSSAPGVPSASSGSSSSASADVANVAEHKIQEKKAAKKQRQRAARALQAVPEGTPAEEGESVLNLKIVQDNVVIASLLPAVEETMQDASEAASVAKSSPPPSWTPEEERYIRSRQEQKDKKEKTYEFLCGGCRSVIKGIQNFLIFTCDGTYLDSAFGGILRGTCFGCSKESDEAIFRRKARASHLALLAACGERRERVRDVVFKQSLQKIVLKFPDLSRTAQRELAVKRIEGMVLCLGAAFAKMTRCVQEAFVRSTNMYIHAVDARATNPGLIGDHGLVSLSYTDTTWLTEACNGLWVSWVCRRRSCRFCSAATTCGSSMPLESTTGVLTVAIFIAPSCRTTPCSGGRRRSR